MLTTTRWVVLGVVALACATAQAGKLGEAAPKVAVDKWVRGDAVDVTAGNGKNVYVVEFWATWCGPCLQSIPHLTKLQKEYKDRGLVVIGVSSSDENAEIVEKFVKSQGDKMAYTVAYEDKEKGKTGAAYMEAFKIQGIPHAFVIDKKGNLVWHGHPMLGMDAVIKAVFEGDYTVESLKDVSEKARKAEMAKMKEVSDALDAYFEMVREKDMVEKAHDAGQKALKLADENAQLLNMMSWEILTNEDIQSRDIPLALAAAKRATELTGGEEPAILDTYARALFDSGKIDDAIKTQKKAVDLAPEGQMKKELAEALKKYEAAKK